MKKMKYINHFQLRTIFNQNLRNGQVVLILVLITVVGLTIGLSLISRTVSDIRISSQIEQSSRAFSAAEAGVENALKGSSLALPTGTVNLPGASAQYSVSSIGGDTQDPENPDKSVEFGFTKPGEVQTLWLIDHDENGNINTNGAVYPSNSSLTVCFSSVQETEKPAVILTFLYKSGSAFRIAKKAYDPNIGRGNNFGAVDGNLNSNCSGYGYSILVPISDFGIQPSDKLYLLRMLVLYKGTTLSVVPSSGIFPVQGKLITSTGESETGIVRRIQVSQSYRVLPSLLDFALYSEN